MENPEKEKQMHESKHASEDERYGILAIKLSEYVNLYTPSHWQEPIRSVMPSFQFTSEEAKDMEAHFNQGDLKQILDKEYQNPNVVDAIYSFFEKNYPFSS